MNDPQEMALSVFPFHSVEHRTEHVGPTLAEATGQKFKITEKGIYFDETSSESDTGSRRHSIISNKQ